MTRIIAAAGIALFCLASPVTANPERAAIMSVFCNEKDQVQMYLDEISTSDMRSAIKTVNTAFGKSAACRFGVVVVDSRARLKVGTYIRDHGVYDIYRLTVIGIPIRMGFIPVDPFSQYAAAPASGDEI